MCILAVYKEHTVLEENRQSRREVNDSKPLGCCREARVRRRVGASAGGWVPGWRCRWEMGGPGL